MGTKEVLLLSLSAALVIVGAHITLTQGIMVSYPVFMFAVALFFWFRLRKVKYMEKESGQKDSGKSKTKKKSK